MFLIEITYL